MKVYSSGTLIWVDDDFLDKPFSDANGELDVWRRTFGEADNRIYRLLNLRLEVARSYDEAMELINEHQEDAASDRFLVAVIDMRIPKTIGGNPQPKHGIAVAERLERLGIPYFILSSAANTRRTSGASRLDRRRYFQKKPAPSPTMMPDDLVRRILSSFRNNITWIDLLPVLRKLEFEAGHPIADYERRGDAIRYFPFFGPFRDFVERWEARAGRERPRRIVLRAAPSFADEFVAQCVCSVMSSVAARPRPRVFWFDSKRPHEFHQSLQRASFAGEGRVDTSMHHIVVRLHGENENADRDFLRSVLRSCRDAHLYIVIPQDEAADVLLNELAAVSAAVYDDIPGVRSFDRSARADLVERAASFVFQRVKVDIGDVAPRRLHPVYLKQPGLLIDPISWTFLNEAEEVHYALNDPMEVVEELSRAAREIDDWRIEDRIALIEGHPPKHSAALLKPGGGVFERMSEWHKTWSTRTFYGWLSNSWRSPYNSIRPFADEKNGARVRGESDAASDVTVEDDLTDAAVEEWETHTLNVSFRLAEDFIKRRTLGVGRSGDALLEAARFLVHPGVRAAFEGVYSAADAGRVEALRWPHLNFPMPVALSRALKAAGLYLWLQTDLLDRAMLLHTGYRAIERVQARAERIDRRLNWLRAVVPTLPAGWSESADLVYRTITDEGLNDIWANKDSRLSWWNSFFGTVKNATPISYLFHRAVKTTPFALSGDDVKKLSKLQGAGTAFGVIRGSRSKRMPELFELTEPQPVSWLRSFEETREQLRFFFSFTAHDGHASHIAPLSDSAIQMGRRICEVDQALIAQAVENSDPAVSQALLNELFAAAFSSSVGLGAWEFFDTAFKPDVPASSALRYGTMRGSTMDLVLQAAELGERLRSLLQPISQLDGFHLLSMTYDVRVSGKDTAPGEEDIDLIERLLELYLAGFEGLVAQLRWLIAAAGRADIAETIPESRVRVRIPPGPVDSLDAAFRVVGSPGDYQVYSLGIPGRTVAELSYFSANGEAQTYDAVNAHAVK